MLEGSFVERAHAQKTLGWLSGGGGRCRGWDAANRDLSDLALPKQRAHRREGVQDSYFEVCEKVQCVPGARCSRKVVPGLTSSTQLTRPWAPDNVRGIM